MDLCVSFENLDALDSFVYLIDRETRPDFFEDVPKNLHSSFELINGIEFADDLIRYGNQLRLIWRNRDRINFEHVKQALEFNGLDFVLAYEIPSYAMSGDEDDTEGWFWISASGLICKADRREAIRATSQALVSLLSKDN